MDREDAYVTPQLITQLLQQIGADIRELRKTQSNDNRLLERRLDAIESRLAKVERHNGNSNGSGQTQQWYRDPFKLLLVVLAGKVVGFDTVVALLNGGMMVP